MAISWYASLEILSANYLVEFTNATFTKAFVFRFPNDVFLSFSVLPSDKLSQGTPPSPPHSSAPSPRDPPWRHGSVQPSATSPGEKPLQKGMQGPPADALSPLRGPRTYSRTYKKVHSKRHNISVFLNQSSTSLNDSVLWMASHCRGPSSCLFGFTFAFLLLVMDTCSCCRTCREGIRPGQALRSTWSREEESLHQAPDM